MAESSGGIRAGKAFVELSLNDKFTRQLDAAAKKLKDFGSSITDIGKKTLAIGSAITAPLLLAAQRYASMGDEINKASQRTGVGIEALQELKYAAEQSGLEFGTLEGGLRKMQKALFEAVSGSPEARKSLAGIGLTIQDLKNLSPDEQFQLIGDRINQITDPAARAAVAMQIFGKSGAELLPLFAEGAEGMQALRDRARALGLVFSKDDAEAATTFGDTLDDLWKQLNAIVFQIGAAVAQGLQPFADKAIVCLKAVIEWTRENRTLVLGVLAAGAALIVLGSTLLGVGLGIKAVGFALSGITSAFKLIGSAIGLLTNPVVLVIGVLAGLTAWFLTSTETGGKVLSWLGGKFNQLAETAKTAFGGIADALAAGDISLAAQILWAALQLAWAQGTHELQEKWIEFKSGMVQTWVAGQAIILDQVAIMKAGMQTLLAEGAAFFVDTWQNAIDKVSNFFSDFAAKRAKQQERDRIQNDLATGKITQAQADRQLKDVDSQGDSVIRANQAKQEQAKAEREKALKDQLATIKADRDRALKQNADEEAAASAAASTNANKDIADLDKRKQELEQKLADLRSQAAQEKSDGTDLEDPFSFGDQAKKRDLEDVVGSRKNVDLKSQGIFNAAAIQSLQSSPVQDAIRRAAEETARNTKRMADNGGNFAFT